jgi:hypothetical protein
MRRPVVESIDIGKIDFWELDRALHAAFSVFNHAALQTNVRFAL